MTTKRAPQKRADEDIHDRVTTSVAKGRRALLQKIAYELGLDVSKLVRFASEDYIRANRHKLSDAVRKELDESHGRLL